jgi:hypothetical protein
MVKPTPITPDEVAHLEEWATILGDRKPGSSGDYRGIAWRYLPGRGDTGKWADVLAADSLYDLPGNDPVQHNLDIVTDDIPYPYDVFRDRTGMWELVTRVSGLSAVMVLIPGVLAFFGTRSKEGGEAAPASHLTTALLVVFFAVLGLAYMLVEVVLIQKLGIFLSSPVISLVVVLGSMLVASGLGGAVSARLSRMQVLGAMGATLLLLGLSFTADAVMQPFFGLPLVARGAVAVVLVAPLAFVMGMPFPHAMGFAKERLGGRHSGLMFAVNGALSAIAAPVSLLLSMTHGFRVTMLAAAALYLLCLGLLALVPRT